MFGISTPFCTKYIAVLFICLFNSIAAATYVFQHIIKCDLVLKYA